MAEILSKEINPQTVILTLKGYLDRILGELLQETVKQSIGKNYQIYVFAFTEVAMINSLGMSGLIEAVDVAQCAEADVWLVDVNPVIMPILEAAGILDLVPDVLTLDEALAKLQG